VRKIAVCLNRCICTIETQASLFITTYNNELGIYLNTGNFEKAKKIIPVIDKGLKTYTNHISGEMKMIFYYNIAYVYFGLNELSKSLKWLNLILNDTKTNLRLDVLSFALIINLIIHFELKHYKLLEHLVIATYRFLSKREKLYKLESIVLNFIRKKLPKINTLVQVEINVAFKELLKELNLLLKDPFEKKAYEYFDFISWLESKIEHKPFAKVVQEKTSRASKQ